MNLTSIKKNNCLLIAQICAPPIIDIPHTDLDHAQTVETRLGACWVMFESISRFFEDFDSLFFLCFLGSVCIVYEDFILWEHCHRVNI